MSGANNCCLKPASTSDAPTAKDVAERLLASAGHRKTIVVTVGLPLCSDGKNTRFGSGIYDPFQEKRLIGLPEEISEAAQRDIEFAVAVHEELRGPMAKRDVTVIFTYSVFDAKMVHGLGREAARRVQAAIVQNPEAFLPKAALQLVKRLNGRIGFDFSLDYRALGDRFIDRLRRAIRPCVPSVPTSRLVEVFMKTGAVLLKQLDESGHSPGMGRILCATPNTLPEKLATDIFRPLDGRMDIQTGFGAVPLTNDNGEYICEVTAIGRLLAMVRRAYTIERPEEGLVTLSILNVCDPGNRKIHRMAWSAGELVSSLLAYCDSGLPWQAHDQTHFSAVSDQAQSMLFDSESDTKARLDFLQRLSHRVKKAVSERKKEDILAGELESVRTRVQKLHEDDITFLSGPGDPDSAYFSDRQRRALNKASI